jgi:hypothetical protein
MKKAGLIGVILLLTGVITFTLLRHRPSANVQLVKFNGVENVTNITKGYLDWQSDIDPSNKMNAVPVGKKDILYCLPTHAEEAALIIQNKELSDKILNVRTDSLGVYVDEHLATLNVNENEHLVSNWLNAATKEDIRYLQSVFVSDSLSDKTIQQLKEIRKYASGIGLIIDSESCNLSELQEVLKPSWMWLSEVMVSPDVANQWSKMDELESLILTEVKMDQLKLEDLKNLKALYIDSPDSITFSQLSELPKGLSTLQISNADIVNLDFLKDKSQLKEITFNHCALLKDIGSVGKLPHLTSVVLANCDSIADLTPLLGLTDLVWFTPPTSISEQQLSSVIHTSPNIQSLVLMDCKQIKSLHLLKDAHLLSCLTMISTPMEADSLLGFKNLKYLAYGAGNSNDSLSIAKLRKEMPNTLVVAAEPFCMGTGWLIVFFVLLIALTLLVVKLKNKIIA